MKLAAGAIAAATIIGLTVWWKTAVWAECRQGNSFIYCLHIIGSN